LASAPRPSYRLIPSQFPPIGLFDTVANSADLEAVMELAGWTNDRLVVERIRRLPRNEWIYGVPNASIVMAAFLHVAPGGMHFNGPELGAWNAADDIRTAAAEAGHHLRRGTVARSITLMSRRYRAYMSTLLGDYVDISGQQKARPELYAHNSYEASQNFGENVRASDGAGILYDSLRRRGGLNVVSHRPRNITEIVQADHFEITVFAASHSIDVQRLS